MRDIKLSAGQILAAAAAGVAFVVAFAVVEHLRGVHTDPLGILERVLPTPSAYPDVSPEELTRRIAALHRAQAWNGGPAILSSLRLDGCRMIREIVLLRDCSSPDDTFRFREWTYDLRLLETPLPLVEVRSMSSRGVMTDMVTFPVNARAAPRIEAASRQWFAYVRGLIRAAPGDGSDLPARMERLRVFAATGLQDRLWERFAETEHFCTWGDITGPPESFFGGITLFAPPGRGRELAELLHAYKLARCPFDPALLDP